MQTILIVDDSPENLAVLSELLLPHYEVRAVTSGERALRAARSGVRPDLVLLDVMMPEMDGYAVLRELKSDASTADIPVMFVTAMDSTEDEERGLSMGAADYITKPIKPLVTLARVRTQLEAARARLAIAAQNTALEQKVAERTREIVLTQSAAICALGQLAEIRDPETGNHIRRTQNYVRLLCERLQSHRRFAHELSNDTIELMVKSAPLHDIGKVGIPDHILLKPGKLTPEEFEVMKTHTALGGHALEKVAKDAGVDIPFLTIATQIARSHHEKWDGSGYPDKLVGDAIPVSARLMAVADVFDALISRRPYKEPFPLPKALAIIREGRGKHFDPDVLDAFERDLDAFIEIAERYSDSAEEVEARLDPVRRAVGA